MAKEPKKVGRPSIRTPKLVEELLERQAKGEPLSKICSDPHMPSFVAVWRWEREDEDFRNDSARARKLGTHYLAGESLTIADDLSLDPQHKRVMVDTRLRLIGKWNRKDYGDKVLNEVTGPDGQPLNTAPQVVIFQLPDNER